MNDSSIVVPTLDQLRAMSDVELFQLRTELTWAAGSVEEQLNAIHEPDADWEARAKGARLAFQRGMSAIKNIVTERSAANKEARDVPLAPWLAKLMEVYAAAEFLMDGQDEDDTAWEFLEAAVDTVKEFMVSHEFAVGVQL